MEDAGHKWVVGYVVRKLVTVGLNRFIESWNCHRIPCKGIPNQLALRSSVLTPCTEYIPDWTEIVRQYELDGGSINDNLNDVNPFTAENRSIALINELIARFDLYYSEVYNKILSGDKMTFFDFIKAHLELYLNHQNNDDTVN